MKKKKLFIRMSAKVILKLLKMFTVFCLLSTPLAANNQLKVYSGDVNYQGFVWYQYNGKVFDHKKPTLIFIHGWPDKRDPGYFKTFKYAEDFLKRGYNVGFYRWQIPVIQFGCKGAGSMRAKVGGFLNAIWEPGGCGDKFRNDLKNIFQYGSLKNYKKAITLMSHSTGAQLIIFGLNDDYLRNNLKLRIVFTDPFLPWQYRDKTAYNTNTTIDVIKKTGKIHPILWICSSFVGRAAYRFHWAKDNSIQKYITRIYLHPRERISEMIGTLSYWRFLKLRRVINKMAKSEDGWYKRELRSTISRLEYRKKKITKRLQGRIENKLEKVDNIIISLQKRRRKAEASKNKKLNSRIGNLQKKISRLERIRAKARFKRRKKKLKKRINRLKDKKRKLEKKKRSSNGVMKAIDKRIAFQKGRKSKITKRINNLLNFRIDFINTRISNLKTKLSKAGNGLERNILQNRYNRLSPEFEPYIERYYTFSTGNQPFNKDIRHLYATDWYCETLISNWKPYIYYSSQGQFVTDGNYCPTAVSSDYEIYRNHGRAFKQVKRIFGIAKGSHRTYCIKDDVFIEKNGQTYHPGYVWY